MKLASTHGARVEPALEPLLAVVNGGCCDEDPLSGPAAVRRWAKAAGWTPPRGAASGLDELRRFRDTLREIVEARIAGRPIRDDALGSLNAALSRDAGARTVVAGADGSYAVEERYRVETLADLRLPLAHAAVRLLVDADPSRLRRCAGCRCAYYDTSKNRTRTWCDMRRCGNRAKAAAYYRRSRGEVAEGPARGTSMR